MSRPHAFLNHALSGLALILSGGAGLMAQIGTGPNRLSGHPNLLKGLHRSKGTADDPAGRINWWRLRWGGDLTPDFMARVMREAELQRLLYSEQFPAGPAANVTLPEGTPLPLAVSATTWTNIGPTKSNKIQNSITLTAVNSGRLRTILPDSTDPNILYVLTAGGGLWKTTDLLDSPPTWRSLSDRVGSTKGGAVAFGRTSSGAGTVLYLGLGDAFDSGVGGFVVKSADAGGTWSSAIQLTGATRVLDLKVDTSQGTTTASDIVLVGTDNGMFRSTDGGATFAAVANANVSGKKVWSIVRTSAGWLATTQTTTTPKTGTIVLSTDLGATWAPVANQIPTSTVFPPTSYPMAPGRMTLAVGSPGDSTVYVFAAYSLTSPTGYDDYGQYDLFYSTNSGSTAWNACHLTVPSTGINKLPANTNGDQADMDLMGGQAFYNQMILVDPTDATRNTVYLAGNLSSARCSNAKAAAFGSSWTLMTNWLPGGNTGTAAMPYAHADFHCAAFTNAGGTARLLLGNDGGLAMGTTTSTPWDTWDHSKNVGIITHLVYAMDCGPLNNCDANSVLMGLQDNGTHNRVGATSVFDQTKGGDGFGVGWSQSTNAATLGTYVYNDISICTTNPPDDQTKWSAFVTGLGATGSGTGADNGASYYFVTPIISAPAGTDATGNVFYTYGNNGTGPNSGKIFKSNSTSWSAIGVPGSGGISAGRYVRAVSHGVSVHPTDANRIAAAGSGGALLLTTNGGATWTERLLSSLVPASGGRTWQGYNAGAEWVDNNNLFACSESTLANSIHVAKSTDGGTTWAASETGLPDLPVVKILCDHGDATGNTLYAATWLGVYRTTNGGTGWSLFGTGLPQSLVTDLYIHPTSSFLRAAVWGRGIWQVGPTPTYTTPTFSVQPASASFTPPAPFSLSGTVSNAYPTVSYQWQRNGVNLVDGGAISGSTTSTLTISPTTCSSGGDFTLTATNCVGVTKSSVATLTSTVASPVITANPANLQFAAGTTFTLSVTATGSGGATPYQWRRNGTNLTNTAPYSGVNTATLTVTTPAAGAAGSFDCVVSNASGCTTTSSAAAVTNGSAAAPNILSNPVNATVSAPNPATFSVTAGGGGAGATVTLNFQWQKNGVNLTNAAPTTWTNASVAVNNSTGTAASTLTINPTADASAGVYSCVATNSAGSATSAGATLAILRQYTPATAVSITPSPALPVPKGTAVTFTAAGSGSVLQGTATPAPAGAYQYQFWLYIDDNLGWTMVQDYGVGSTYTMSALMQPGTYGIGVDCRTSPTVLWDVFNAINVFTVTPAFNPNGPEQSLAPRSSHPTPFDGGHGSNLAH